MIYLNNNTILQDVYIPRQDMLQYTTGSSGTYAEGYADGYDDGTQDQKDKLAVTAFTENGEYERENGWSAVTVDVPTGSTVTLEEKSVTISADTTVVLPSSGFDGMSAVTVDASQYAQDNYDNGFDDGFDDGYASGSTEEREKLSAVTFTANTAVTMDEGGYSAVTVNVAQTGHTDQELEDAYTSGHTDGMDDQKQLLTTTAFTQNGNYTRENGWSGVSVNVDTASTYQSGYTSGHTDGVSEEKAKLSATTFTANTAVTLNDGGYSAITVNVPQTGSSVNIEPNKPFTATSNGNYTILPSSGTVNVNDRFDSDLDRYYLTASISGYPSTGYFELLTIEDEFDSSKGYIEVYFNNGVLDYDDSEWNGGEVDDRSFTSNVVEIVIKDANRDFDWTGGRDFDYHYDVMSAVSLNVNVPQTGTSATLGDGSFSANGTYSASTDNLDGYSAITINVPTGMTSKDIIMCVSGGCWFNTNYEIEYGDSFDLEHCTFGVSGVPGISLQHATLIAGNNYDTLRLNHSPNDVYFRYFYNTINYNIPLPSSGSAFEDNHIIFNSTGITIDGNVVYSYTTNPYSGKGKLIVFADTTNGGNLARGQIAKIGRIKVYGSNGALKATFEPRLDENNFPYFKYIEENIDIYASGDTAPFYEEIIVDSSYQSGFTDGMAHQKSLLGTTAFTSNGSFSAENGYSAITVNVPQQAGVYGSKTINVNGTYSASTDSLDGFSSVTVNVPQSGVQIPIFFADYIHTDTLSSNTYQDYIDTGLFPTDDVVFRVKGYRKGEQQGTRIVGWCPEETNHSDSQDFRLFWAGGRTVYFDWGYGRINYDNYFDSLSGYTDITCGNYYVYDNVEEQMIVSGSQESVSELYSAGTIRADVGSWWLKSLEIYDGNTLLFDGVAAYDGSGNVGLYDKVSHTLKTAVTTKQMVYEFDSGSTLPLSSITFTENTSVTVSDKAYTAITVNVDTASTYNSGYTEGQNDVISTFSSMTATTNGIYGTSAHPLSSITVNVPQTSGLTLIHPTIERRTNGTRTIYAAVYAPSIEYTSYQDGGYRAVEVDAFFYPNTGYFDLLNVSTPNQEDGFISIYYQNGELLYDATEWNGGTIICTTGNSQTATDSGVTYDLMLLKLSVSSVVMTEGADADLADRYAMSAITIVTNVDTASTYQSGYTSGFTDGYNSGYTDVNTITGTTSFSANGTYNNSSGWSAVTVSVPQGGGSGDLGMAKALGYRQSYIRPNRRIELGMRVKFTENDSFSVLLSQVTPYHTQYDGGIILQKETTNWGVGNYASFGILHPATGGTSPTAVTYQSPSFLYTADTWYDMSVVCTFSTNRIALVVNINNVEVANFSAYTTVNSQLTGNRMFKINDPSEIIGNSPTGIGGGKNGNNFAYFAISTLKVYDTTDNTLIDSINYYSNS